MASLFRIGQHEVRAAAGEDLAILLPRGKPPEFIAVFAKYATSSGRIRRVLVLPSCISRITTSLPCACPSVYSSISLSLENEYCASPVIMFQSNQA